MTSVVCEAENKVLPVIRLVPISRDSQHHVLARRLIHVDPHTSKQTNKRTNKQSNRQSNLFFARGLVRFDTLSNNTQNKFW